MTRDDRRFLCTIAKHDGYDCEMERCNLFSYFPNSFGEGDEKNLLKMESYI